MAHGPTTGAAALASNGAVHPLASTRLSGVKGRPDNLSVGVITWLASDLMFFAALFAAYFSLREITNAAAIEAGTTSMWEWGASHLDNQWFGITYPWFATINTLVLLLSSCTAPEEDGPDYTPVPDKELFAEVEQIKGVVSADLDWSDEFGRPNTYDGTIRTRGVSACEVLDHAYAILWQGRPDATLLLEVEQPDHDAHRPHPPIEPVSRAGRSIAYILPSRNLPVSRW